MLIILWHLAEHVEILEMTILRIRMQGEDIIEDEYGKCHVFTF